MKLAAITYEAGKGDGVDSLLRDVAHKLRAKGFKLAGAVQWNEPMPGQSRCAMVLEDLATGERLDVSAEQSNDPHACRLNAYALEEVAGRVAGSIGPGVDLVILNRFGKQEAARAGFRAIIEAAVANELPVLTGLNAAHRPLWQDFTGGASDELKAESGAVYGWCSGVLSVRGAS